MADVKQGWTAARGLILAAATGFPSLAHAAPPRSVVQLAPQRTAPRRAYDAPPSKSATIESIPIESLPVESLPVEPAPKKSMPDESKRFKTAPVESTPIEPDCRAADCRHKRSRPIAQWWERHKAHCRDKLWGYPEEFVPAQLGAAVADNISRQVARAQEARMVVYQYDFLPMSYELKPRARMALAKYGEWASHGAGPIFIEPTLGHPDLDEARRLAVWRELQCGPFAIPPEMIAVGCSEILGVRGGEALLIDKNLMMQTSARGTAMGGGGGGGLLGSGGVGGGMAGGMAGGMSSGGTSGGSTGSTGMGY
ncbi:MAG TPA: hypothetical protein VHB99_12185 [Pirellulales bacterium]|nr:hypothetical protein [Pirellulales bacterium]